MTKSLVTGHKGFIGSNLYNVLKKNPDYDVFGLEFNDLSKTNWINDLKSFLNKTTPTVIFHVGACTDTLNSDVNYMMTLNFEFTKIVADWCRIYDVPLIYSSSASGYGTNGEYPSNLYGWSKYTSEKYVISNGGVALRYFNVYGPGEEHKGKMASVAYQMYIKQKNGEDIKLFPLNPKRDFVYIKDVINANIYAFEHHFELSFNYYDVGTGDSNLFEDVLHLLEIDFNYHEKNVIPNGYQFKTCSDRKKWMNGWEPEYDLDRGMKEYKIYLDENYSNR